MLLLFLPLIDRLYVFGIICLQAARPVTLLIHCLRGRGGGYPNGAAPTTFTALGTGVGLFITGAPLFAAR